MTQRDTDRSLVHSLRSSRGNDSRAFTGHSVDGLRRELDRSAGEVHVRLLQRRPVPAQLGEGDTGARSAATTTRVAGQPVDDRRCPRRDGHGGARVGEHRSSPRRCSVTTSTRSFDAAASSVGDAGVGDQPAAADDDQVVGGVLQLAHQVAGDEHRPALARPAPAAGPRIQTMPSGSRPLTGSSKIRTGGSPSRAAAMPSRCCMPSENPPARRRPPSRRPTCSRTSSTRRFGDAVAVREPQQVVAGRAAGMHRRRVQQRPDLGQRRRASVGLAADQRRHRRRARRVRGSGASWWTCRRRWVRRTR